MRFAFASDVGCRVRECDLDIDKEFPRHRFAFTNANANASDVDAFAFVNAISISIRNFLDIESLSRIANVRYYRTRIVDANRSNAIRILRPNLASLPRRRVTMEISAVCLPWFLNQKSK